MSARVFQAGLRETPRRTFETPTYLFQEWPEHVARSCAAIRLRRDGRYPAKHYELHQGRSAEPTGLLAYGLNQLRCFRRAASLRRGER